MTQETRRNILDTESIISEDELKNIIFPLLPGDRVFLCGDLGAGKSTFIRALLRAHFDDPNLTVRSPTYTYFQKYPGQMKADKGQITMKNSENNSLLKSSDIYHFDLYRVENSEDILLIGALDVFADPTSICLIEWPEILGDTVNPTITVDIEKVSDTERKFTLRGATA